MISALQKYFCVLQFSKTESVISVLRAFQRRFGIAAPRTFVDSTACAKMTFKSCYKLHMVQARRVGNRTKRMKCSNVILRDMKDDNFLPCLIFSDDATFHISGKVIVTMSDYRDSKFHKRS